MKILIVSYDFYPEAKPNTYRWFNIAKKWVDEGIEVHVITANKNAYLEFEEIEGVKIYRTTEYFLGNLKYKFRGNLQINSLDMNKQRITFKVAVKKMFRKIYDLTWSNLYWPDHSFLWQFSAVPMASKIIDENKIDKLITVSWTFSAHRIGYKLANKHKNLYWLADTIDPFSYNAKVNNTFLYGKLNRAFEKKIFEKADLNCVLTDRIRKKYVSLFPNLENKIVVNNNVFIPTDYNYSNEKSLEEKKIKIVFLGTLSTSTRSPENLLILLKKLVIRYPDLNFTFDFYGDLTDTVILFQQYPQLLNDHIKLNGFIDRTQLNLVIKNADVLLNIGNNNEYQEPSKLIEYMYSGKKILNICSIMNDTSAELLKIYPLSLSIFSDEIDRMESVEKMVDFFQKDAIIDEESLKSILKDYLFENVANKYLSFISERKQ
ncbi:hypothetical protein [Flavobacterium sp. MMS24-S5]|uniref:hypothetical protein n=1 Tax=Flavobacterium sp. MMS24-S5 TaxID=3416605 RepID=UPI003D061FA6